MDALVPFPYEIQPLDPRELAVLRKYFVGYHYDYIRVGPKGYVYHAGYKEDAANIYNMSIRPDDIFVCTFPRSGTTLTQELVWMVMNNFNSDEAKSKSLDARYIFPDFFIYYPPKIGDWLKENQGAVNDPETLSGLMKLASLKAEQTASPRFIKTHVQLSLLPSTLLDTCKMLYVARDPRDVAVSVFHLYKGLNLHCFQGTFKEFWNDIFLPGLFTWAPYFPHVKEAWSARHHPNLLFLFYEDMIRDLSAAIRRIAEFLGKPITEAQVAALAEHLNIDNFRNNESVKIRDLKGLGIFAEKLSFVRKGKSGGWRNYFDEEMCKQANAWIADNLRDTDLQFPQ